MCDGSYSSPEQKKLEQDAYDREIAAYEERLRARRQATIDSMLASSQTPVGQDELTVVTAKELLEA